METSKKISNREKIMIALIVMLVIGIILRWAYIQTTLGKAIKERFIPPTEQVDSLSVG